MIVPNIWENMDEFEDFPLIQRDWMSLSRFDDDDDDDDDDDADDDDDDDDDLKVFQKWWWWADKWLSMVRKC